MLKKFIICFSFFLFTSIPASAQEKGMLASVLANSCEEYLLSSQTPYQSNYCSGYLDAMIEHKQFLENKDFFNCFPTYGDFDPFKSKIMKLFIEKAKNNNDKFVRSYNILNDIIDEQFHLKCNKQESQ